MSLPAVAGAKDLKKCLREKSKFEDILLGDFIFCASWKGGYYSVFVEGPPQASEGNAGEVRATQLWVIAGEHSRQGQ